MAAAVGSSCDVSGAAHVPAPLVRWIPLAEAAGAGRSLTLLRLEGVAPSVAHRRAALTDMLRPYGEVGGLAEIASRALWRSLRDVTPFATSRTGLEQPVWRISTVPGRGADLAQMIGSGAETEVQFDWAGGLVWVLFRKPGDDAGAALVRRAVADCGGHATLIRAPAALRAAADSFQPNDEGLAALTRRVKEGFDPQGVLNPGRMWAGV
jgi:glycolate oxidase FAD binding subunit